MLPPSVSVASHITAPREDAARRARERAEARLQSLAKEPDWRVARAYVALAEEPDSADDTKCKEGGSLRKRNVKGGDVSASGSEAGVLEERVLDSYMDDSEWEERERREGRAATLQGFPYFAGQRHREKSRRPWWPW